MAITADLSGKRALVTGASSAGFGRFFAQVLAEAGAEVIVSARRQEPLQELAEKLCEMGFKASPLPLDVTDDAAVRGSLAELGALDIVVNNAGIAVTKPLLDQTPEDYDFVVNTNQKGVWNIAVESARAMHQAGRPGSIINIASITGLRQIHALAPYAVSKAAVIQMTSQMALELARYGIRVNAIAPGYFETDINRSFWETGKGRTLIDRVPQRRLGNYASLRSALLMLSDDDSDFITGTCLPVDGGHIVSSL